MVHRFVEQKQVCSADGQERQRQSRPLTIRELASRAQNLFGAEQELMEKRPYLTFRADGQRPRLSEGSFVESDAFVFLAVPTNLRARRPDNFTGANRHSLGNRQKQRGLPGTIRSGNRQSIAA